MCKLVHKSSFSHPITVHNRSVYTALMLQQLLLSACVRPHVVCVENGFYFQSVYRVPWYKLMDL